MSDGKDADISRLQASLAELEGRIQSLVTNLPTGLIIVNQNQCIEALNQRARTIFESESKEVAGQSINHLFPEIEKITQQDKPIQRVGRRGDGEKFLAELQITSLNMYGEERFFVNVQDINERHKLERLRKELLEMISHDLRAPLMAIQFTLEMLDDGSFGEQTTAGKKAIGNAMSSTTYLTSMVKNLLDSEKIERNEIDLDIQKTSVKEIVEKAVTTAEIANLHSKIAIKTELTNDEFEADPDRIVQILLNLITNAIKFSPDNSSVLVKAGMDGINIKFEVADEGPGIPEEDKRAIFERYRQLGSDKKQKSKGFGLGLAICRGLVEKHGGKIWADNQADKGARLCFTVPIEAQTGPR